MGKRHNPIAKDLRSQKYRQRIVKSKKPYTRKGKHGTRCTQETNAEGIEETTQFDEWNAADDDDLEGS